MKYIRTKSGKIIHYDENADKIDQPSILDYPNDIVKINGSVEELLDMCLIVIYSQLNDTKFTLARISLAEAEDTVNYHFKEYRCEIYGCILIFGAHDEPTLKPVAKVNKKGKLELL